VIADVVQLYDQLAPRLRSMVLREVNAPAPVIEDACQIAWYRLVRHAHRNERGGALSWLARTAVHEAVRLTRRDQRELSLEARINKDGELDIPNPGPEPHEQVQRRERPAEVRRLPIHQQRLLWLKAVGLGYKQRPAPPTADRATGKRHAFRLSIHSNESSSMRFPHGSSV
jgi:DNA-directed RNA polymerase specialized sigma24 family protein